MNLTDGSSFEGCFSGEITNASGETVSAAIGSVTVTIDESSVWTLTGDCVLESLTNNGTINFNGHTITLSDGTVLQ